MCTLQLASILFASAEAILKFMAAILLIMYPGLRAKYSLGCVMLMILWFLCLILVIKRVGLCSYISFK